MKKHVFITKLFAAFVVAISPMAAHAASSDLTATGSVSLSRPAGVTGADEGIYKSDVSFRATVTQTDGNAITGPTTVSKAKTSVAERISNKQIIENAVGEGNSRGYKLIWVHFGNLSSGAPQLYAYNAKNTELKKVDDTKADGLSLDIDWIDFVGVYKGSGVVSSTATGTATQSTIFLASGNLSGSTGYDARLTIDSSRSIAMSGVGSFAQNTKGITGRSSLSGVYVQP
jgi:hypothetical protein